MPEGITSKKVLVIAYIFPPLARAGVHRTVRFVRYLAPLGWDITVLTADEAYYPADSPIDRELVKKIPATVRVEATKVTGGLNKILEFKNRRLTKAKGKEQKAKTNEQPATSNQKPATSLWQRSKNLITDVMTIPDKDVNWLPYALTAALKLNRREHFEVIYSTAPPFTGHLVAYLVKKMTGLPWVADFRDPWARAPWKAELMNGTLRGRAAEKLEAKFVQAADRVILNTTWAARDFAEHYGATTAQKFAVIPNGFDPEDFMHRPATAKKTNKLVMTHTGSLYRKRDPGYFFEALGRLLANGAITADEIELRFVGGIAPELYQSFQYAEELQSVIKIIPPVTHREALAYQAESDVLLILQPGTSVSIPGKIFEYIAMRKKILALTPAGATAEVVRDHDLGIVAAPEDLPAIQSALLRLVKEFRNGGVALPSVDGAFQKYDGVRLTRQLHEELQRCADKR